MHSGKDKQWGKVHRIDLSVPLFMDETHVRNGKGVSWRKEMMNFPVIVIGFGHHFKAPHFQASLLLPPCALLPDPATPSAPCRERFPGAPQRQLSRPKPLTPRAGIAKPPLYTTHASVDCGSDESIPMSLPPGQLIVPLVTAPSRPQSVNPANVKKGKGQVHTPLQMYKVGVENWLAALHKIDYPGRVFWIPFTPSHFEGGSWNTGGKCSMYTAPTGAPMRMSQVGTTAKDWLDVLTDVLARGPNPRHAELFDIATMSDMRPDAHPGDASQFPIKAGVQDCVHWCMPGVTDTWNEMLAYKLQCKG